MESIDDILETHTKQVVADAHAITGEIVNRHRQLRQFVPLTPPRTLSEPQSQQLRDVLLNPAAYWYPKKRCLPQDLHLRFHFSATLYDNPVSVTVLFELACRGISIRGPRKNTGAFFDRVADDVYALTKAVFPELVSPHDYELWKHGAIETLIANANNTD